MPKDIHRIVMACTVLKVGEVRPRTRSDRDDSNLAVPFDKRPMIEEFGPPEQVVTVLVGGVTMSLNFAPDHVDIVVGPARLCLEQGP